MILAIDFGTTYTVAATAEGGQITLVDAGGGSPRMPSAVCLSQQGELIVGAAATRQAVFAPDRFEPTPKRLVGDRQVLLGDRLFSVEDVIAAVIARVTVDAQRKHGGDSPDEVRITHPADWDEYRCGVLRAATTTAGLPEPELLAEPVAAAYRIGASRIKVDDHVAVYDFGGGTFDAAVVRRTRTGFEVKGDPGGHDRLGGESIDQRILDYLSEGPLGRRDDWKHLLTPPDETWRRHARDLRTNIREAKEALSEHSAVDVWIPGIEVKAQLSRAEFEELIRDDIDHTIQIMRETIASARLTPDELAGIFLVGGSSRIPLVAQTLWRAFDRKPDVEDDPKAVVALGAAGWEGAEPLVPASRFGSRVAMARSIKWVWNGRTRGRTTVRLDGGGAIVQVVEAPATVNDATELAAGALAGWQQVEGFRERRCVPVNVLGRNDGLERLLVADHMGIGVPWLERYAVIDDRAIVVTAHQAARAVADAVQLVRPALDPAQHYEPAFSVGVPDGWTLRERIELVRAESGYKVTVDSAPVEKGMTTERWAQTILSSIDESDTIVEGLSRARVFGQAGGASFTRLSADGKLTRCWLLLSEGRGYTLTVTLPRRESLGFDVFQRHAQLKATGGATD